MCTLFNKFIAAFQASSDSIKSRRRSLWRKHENNDDGANAMRRNLSAAKSIVYATVPDSGGGRRASMLRHTIAKHPLFTAGLQLTEQRIASWEPRVGLDYNAVAADIVTLHNEASVARCDLSVKIADIVRATVRSQFATDAQKNNHRGQRCYRNLTNFVMTRARRSGHYASLVTEDKTNDGPTIPSQTPNSNRPVGKRTPKMKVTSDKREVAKGLVDQFFAWMGGGKQF